jgi:N4-gp56 family major capsid protein
MDNLTTRTEIPVENTSFYSRELLERAVAVFLHTQFAQVKDIPGGSGTALIKFRKYDNLTANTTPLVEGVTPTGKKLSITDVTAQVLYYGDYVVTTDVVSIETLDPILTETAGILGDQVGDSLDQLMRDIMAAGTTVQYASTATQRSEVTSAMKFNSTECKEAVLTLKLNLAKPVTSRIDPSTGYNTIPLKASYIGIIHPRTTSDCEADSAWTPVEKYSNKSDVMMNEVGAFPYVRFLETTNAKYFDNEGSGSIDVYGTLIFGRNAYAMTRISTLTLQNIVKPLGSAGADDPLNQRATSGWKLSFVGKILQQPWIIRIEHAVS